MMKKYIISIVCALCAINGTAWAGPVDSQDAKQKAAARKKAEMEKEKAERLERERRIKELNLRIKLMKGR